MGDLNRLGYDVKARLNALSAAVIRLAERYLTDQIKGRQLVNGLRNALAQAEEQLERLDVTMLEGQIEDFTKLNSDNTVLGGMREDFRALDAKDPFDADEAVDLDFD